MTFNPFNMTGTPFLILYGVLLMVTIIAGIAIPRWLRTEGRRQPIDDPDQLAVLCGGRARFADSLVTRLLTRGDLSMIGKNSFGAKPGARGATAAEMSVLSLAAPIQWSAIIRRLPDYAEPIEAKLVALGLWIDDGEKAGTRFWQTLPYMMLIAFGSIKLLVGEARHKPVGFLTGLLIVTVILAAIRFFAIDRRTAAGVDVVDVAKRQHQRLKIAPTTDEAALGVALFGTTVLAGSSFAAFHQMRAASGSSGGDSGGSSDGGSGCGGGGCGGCGG